MHTIGGKIDVLKRLVFEHRPDCYVEIGAYKLETTSILSDLLSPDAAIVAIDLYEQAPVVEKPPEGVPATLEEAEAVLARLSQKRKRVLRANSRDLTSADLPELGVAERPFVFIDGGHSIETGMSDFKLIMASLGKSSSAEVIVVIDDVGMAGTDAVVPMARAWAALHEGVLSSETSMLVLRGRR